MLYLKHYDYTFLVGASNHSTRIILHAVHQIVCSTYFKCIYNRYKIFFVYYLKQTNRNVSKGDQVTNKPYLHRPLRVRYALINYQRQK